MDKFAIMFFLVVCNINVPTVVTSEVLQDCENPLNYFLL